MTMTQPNYRATLPLINWACVEYKRLVAQRVSRAGEDRSTRRVALLKLRAGLGDLSESEKDKVIEAVEAMND